MDIVCSFWGALLWLLIGGIGVWIIKSLISKTKIDELTDSILDRDRRLMAISHEHTRIAEEHKKKSLALKSELTHIESSNASLKIHNTDLRNTIDTLRKSQEEQLSLLFEPQTKEIVSESVTLVPSPDQDPSQEIKASPTNYKKEISASNRKLKRTKRKLKEANHRTSQLEKRVKELALALKQRPNPKTIIKEIPVTIREEVRITESVDKKKLEKIFGFKAPIVRSKKTVQISKKKGKAVIVKS